MSSDCGCGDGNCAMERRAFIKVAGLGAAALAASAGGAFAGPFTPADFSDHFVPADKKLNRKWMASLWARGEREWFSGTDLETIGLPIGGICAGQVYLGGDGRLISWDIFNSQFNTGYGAENYKPGRKATEMFADGKFREPPEVAQGAAVQVRIGDQTQVRPLSAEGFPGVRFAGEHPLGIVEYADEAFPIEISLEAFSPFIPLAAEDSALPATVMRYTVRNRSAARATVTIAGWLENAVCRFSAESFSDQAERVATTNGGAGFALAEGWVRPRADAPSKPAPREPLVFADFEGDDYAGWTVEGEAFGAGPAQGTLANQNTVSAFKGRRLVNSYLGGSDRLQGRLLSPEFTIDRPFIAMLVGGGGHQNETCVNLLVDGKVARTATGKSNERLEPTNWQVEDLRGKPARIEILDRSSAGWGHINVDQIEFRDEPMGQELGPLHAQADFGRMCIAAAGPGAVAAPFDLTATDRARSTLAALEAAQPTDPAGPAPSPLASRQGLAAGRTAELAPGETAEITLVYTWFMPNLARVRGSTQDADRVGHRYVRRFDTAAQVAAYVVTELDRLSAATHAWHHTLYDSTLPVWLLDRVGATTCNLATNTCQWWQDGRFWAWEGVGCCHGTCGHVWNYAHTMARLFPELERSVRERQDFAPGVGFIADTGEIRFRGEGWGIWAGDSQGGYILKAYREHLCAPDDAFLTRNWPAIRKATEFLFAQDADDDGLIEGLQHQTYDENYFGANTMVGSLYLGALRAAEEMARRVNDAPFAERCRAVFEAGKANSVKRLFNGEYFIQEVDLAEHPKWQYADGCLADQLFGQGWAHQIGLGYVYPPETVHAALESIWKYCWAPDIGPQNQAHAPERWFAYPGEAGLFTCTWPKGDHLGPQSTRYRDEIWTGIEYQVAGHMAWEGLVAQALVLCRAVHDRYHPSRRNPFNEIECGDHYARAMAAWGVLTGLAGFEYDGPAGRLGFAPRFKPEDFRAVFTAAEGWGQISQTRSPGAQDNAVTVRFGRVRLNSLAIEIPEGAAVASVTVTSGGPARTVHVEQTGQRVRIGFPGGLELGVGDELRVRTQL